jgi:hypothetical protein
MKKITKVVLGMFLAVIFGTILGSNQVDASDHSVGGIYHYKVVRIRSMLNPARVVGINEASFDQVLLSNMNVIPFFIEWEGRYLPDTDTYRFFKFGVKDGKVLPIHLGVSDSKDANGNNLIDAKLTQEGYRQEWRLIPVESHKEGIVYLFESVSNEGMVMDVPDNNADQENLILFRRHGRANQQFIIQEVGDGPIDIGPYS